MAGTTSRPLAIVLVVFASCGVCNWIGSVGDEDGTTKPAALMDAPAAVTDERSAALDSSLTALAVLVDAGDHTQAATQARQVATSNEAAPIADSLRALADELEQYELARQIPGRELQRNRDVYADLATRYPSSPRVALYAEKQDDYSQRIIDAEAARLRALSAPRASRGRGGGSGCCRRCSTGKPCGDSCISRSYNCYQPPGCAC